VRRGKGLRGRGAVVGGGGIHGVGECLAQRVGLLVESRLLRRLTLKLGLVTVA
jgi:hypothetical protein